jgi:hypothetical protein
LFLESYIVKSSCIAFLSVTAFSSFVTSCRTHKPSTQLASAGFHSAKKYSQSIGIVAQSQLSQEPNVVRISLAGGTGFLIAATDDEWIGITNRHVWDSACQSKCFISFPADNEFKQWKSYELSLLRSRSATTSNMEPVISPEAPYASPTKPDYAMFSFKKAPEQTLELLPFVSDEIAELSIVAVYGWPGAVFRSGDKSIFSAPPVLVNSRGIVTKNYGGFLEITAQLRHGNSGGPLFVWNGGKQFVAGFVFASSDDSKQWQEIDNPYSTKDTVTPGNRASAMLMSELKKNLAEFPEISALLETHTSKIDFSKIHLSSDFSSCVLDSKIDYWSSGQNGARQTGAEITLKLCSDIKDPKKIFFDSIPMHTLNDYAFDDQSGIAKFFIPLPNYMPRGGGQVLLEYEHSEDTAASAECMELQRGIAVQGKFSVEVLESIRRAPTDPQWVDKKFDEAKLFIKEPNNIIWQDNVFLCRQVLSFEEE